MYVSSCRPSLILHLPDVSLLSSPINQVKTSTCHLLTHFLLAVWRESERWGGSGALESAPVQFWDYRIVSICISMYLHLYQCLFAFPFGVAAVKIHNTTLIRSNGMTLSATATDSANSAHFTAKSLKSQTPNPKPRTDMNPPAQNRSF